MRAASGPRNYVACSQLLDAAAYIEARFREAGYPDVLSETYAVGSKTYANLSVEVPGRSKPSEIVIVGGHYDSVVGCPGANDNLAFLRGFFTRDLGKILYRSVFG